MRDWFVGHRHWCMSILRAYLGTGLFIKGIDFIRNRDALLQLLNENNVLWSGAALAHVIILTHLLGGLLMALGLGTRVGALIQLPTLIGAVFFVHGKGVGQVFSVGEELRFSALVLMLLILFVWYGSGSLSLKSLLGRDSAANTSTVQ